MAGADDDTRLHAASQALKEIKAGRAKGFRIPLYGRLVVEKVFKSLARLYTYDISVAVLLFATVIIVYGAFTVGMVTADVEQDVNSLIVSVQDQEDLDYTDRFLGGDAATLEQIIQGLDDGCDDLLYRDRRPNYVATLQDHLSVLRGVITLQVPFRGRNFTFRDLCAYGPFVTGIPDYDRVMNALHTCAMFSPIDCFWEGSILQNPPDDVTVERPSYCTNLPPTLNWGNFVYQDFVDCLLDNQNQSNANPQLLAAFGGLGFVGFTHKSCFSDHPDCPVQNRLSEPVDLNYVFENLAAFQNVSNDPEVVGCIAATSTSVSPSQLIETTETCSNGSRLVRALKSSLILSGVDSVQANLRTVYGIDYNQSDILNLLDKWKNYMRDYIKVGPGRRNLTSNDVIVSESSNLSTQVAEELSLIIPALLITGYVLMIIYCGLTFAKFALVKSRASVGLVGLFVVILGTIGALGITAAAGLKLTLLTSQLYPFLVLGLGVDDMFVIVEAFLELEKRKGRTAPIRDLIVDTMVAAGPSVTLTSITNFIGFWLVYLIPVPLFRGLVIEITVAIFLNYIGLVVALPCYLIIDHYRVKYGMVDIFCCIPASFVRSKKDKEKKGEAEPSKFRKWMNSVQEEYQSFITYFVVEYYSPFLQNFVVKLVTVVLFFGLLGISIWGCFRVEERASNEYFVEADSYELEFSILDERYFSTDPFAIAVKDIDYANLQPQLLAMDERIATVTNVLSPTIGNRFWLKVMIDFFAGIRAFTCDFSGDPQTLITIISLVDPSSTVPECEYTLLDSVPADNNASRTIQIIPPSRFYRYLRVWATFDALNLALLGAFLNPPPQLHTDFSVPVEPAEPLLYSQTNRFIDKLIDVDAGERFIRAIARILDDYEDDGVDAYNLGFPYIVYVPYLHLEGQILTGAIVIILSCFATTTVFLMDIHSGLIMGGILVVGAVNVLGFMGHFKIVLSYFPAMMYMAGIAIMVEFTAPLAFYFLKATADSKEDKRANLAARGGIFSVTATVLRELDRRNERMHKALQHRFVPILNGAITTFISVMMLYFAPIRFVRDFYWGILMIIIVFGLLNGLLFLPVLLSLIGPFAQVWYTSDARSGDEENAGRMVAENPLTEEEVEKEKKEEATNFMY